MATTNKQKEKRRQKISDIAKKAEMSCPVSERDFFCSGKKPAERL